MKYLMYSENMRYLTKSATMRYFGSGLTKSATTRCSGSSFIIYEIFNHGMRYCVSGEISHNICNHEIFGFWCNIFQNMQL